MLSLIALESTFGILDLKDTEIIVFPVELLQLCSVDLILEFGYSKIFDFDRVGDCPLKTDRYGRQLVSVLQHLELGAAMECLSLKPEKEGLAVADLEEHVQVVLHDFLRVVKYRAVDLLSRSE
jgi:hypothetical protein